MLFSIAIVPFNELSSQFSPLLLLATAEAANAPIVLTGVLLSLVIIYIASKLGGELSKRLDLPPVSSELIAGVVVGVSTLHLLMFLASGAQASDSMIMTILQSIDQLHPDVLTSIFQSQSEVISVLAKLGVIILLFEIGLESGLRQVPESASVSSRNYC